MVKKLKLYKNFSVSKNHKNSILLIGNFDGLHIGHQKLFKKAPCIGGASYIDFGLTKNSKENMHTFVKS